MGEQRERVIRASEIGRYAYCAHAWWLGTVQRLSSEHRGEIVAGEAAHTHHGLRARASIWLNRLAASVLLLAVVVGIIWLAG